MTVVVGVIHATPPTVALDDTVLVWQPRTDTGGHD